MRGKSFLVRTLSLGLLATLAGCETKTPTFLDSQVLDRPTDMAMICAHLRCTPPDAEGKVDPASCTTILDPMSTCVTPASINCRFTINETGVSRAQLFGFVTSSGRNELAMVSACEGEVVDTNIKLPGLNPIPVGEMPNHVSASDDSCRVLTSNAGSCDFSLVKTTAFATLGLGIEEERDGSIAATDDVTTLVAQALDPQNGQWRPIGVSASALSIVPSSVLGREVPEEGGSCDPSREYRAYALFPSCDLLAEIDLKSGQILQSLQWQKQGDAVAVVNTGQSPVCPVPDCSGQSQGAAPSEQAPPLAKLSLRSFDLVQDFPSDSPNAAAIYLGGLGGSELYEVRVQRAGGAFSDQSRSLPLFDNPGIARVRVSPRFAPNKGAQTSQVDCAQLPSDKDPEGQTRFAYVIASDGSTRVVQLDSQAQGDQMGQECNTQKDPVALQADGQARCLCVPVVPKQEGQEKNKDPNAFRLLADGPGIRPVAEQERLVDWAFVPASDPFGVGLLQAELPENNPLANYSFEGMMSAIGMTSRGHFVITSFGQYQRRLEFPGAGLASVDHLDGRSVRVKSTANDGLDPDLGNPWRPVLDRFATLRLGLASHALNSLSSLTQLTVEDGKASTAGIPLAGDTPAQLSGVARADIVSALAPALRRIDLTYRDRAAKVSVPGAAGSPMAPFLLDDSGQVARIADGLGRDARGQWGFYADEALRVVPRDYRSWPRADFELAWEGRITGARSAQGRLECAGPSADQSACESQGPGELALSDDSIDFCDRGVMDGDVLRLLSCRGDSDCGTGQACLKRSSNANEQPGLCVSKLAIQNNQDAMRKACAPYLYNPCGEASLDFEISAAFAHRLELKSLPLREMSHWASSDSCPAGGQNNHLEKGACVCDPGMIPCGPPLTQDAQGRVLAIDCGRPAADGQSCVEGASEESSGHEVIDRFVCQERQPEGGCRIDPDCDNLRLRDDDLLQLSPAGQRAAARYCVAGQCRRPCLSFEEAGQLSAQDREIILNAPGADEETALGLQGQQCVRQQAPGPKCFAELLRYEVRARNAFVLQSTDSRLNFFRDSVRREEGTQRCLSVQLDGTAASLRQSRIPLPAEQSEIEAMYPACNGTEIPALNAPFVCRETQVRQASPTARAENRFHTFAYRNPSQVVSSLRVSNPIFSINLDLTGLSGLAERIPGQPTRWPTQMAAFRRARIPHGYSTRFQIGRSGYTVIRTRPLLGRTGSRIATPLVFPSRLVQHPAALHTLFAIDSVARGAGALGARGQVVKLDARGGDERVVAVDRAFNQVQ